MLAKVQGGPPPQTCHSGRRLCNIPTSCSKFPYHVDVREVLHRKDDMLLLPAFVAFISTNVVW